MNASATQPHSRSAGRIVLIAVGACVALIALVGGAALVGIHTTQRDSDGYYSSGRAALSSPTHALVADDLGVDSGPGPLFRNGRVATVRVTAAGTGATRIFVGVGRQSQVDSYLANVAYDDVEDIDVRPFSVEKTTRHRGAAVPSAPASRTFWTDSASGTGAQTIVWPLQKGNWSIVVMNADGSRGVATEVSVGAKIGLLLWAG